MSITQIEMQYMDTIRRELPAIRKALERIAGASPTDLTALNELVADTRRAADSDSNDYEIVALQMALEAALELVPGWKDPA
jgi:hypothetical protein